MTKMLRKPGIFLFLLFLDQASSFQTTPVFRLSVAGRRWKVRGCRGSMNLEWSPSGTGGMQGAIVTKSGPNQYDVDVDGAMCKNGKLGKVIYDKILADQKRMYTRKPMPGFKAGTIPPQIMPRIKFAAVEQLCSQTCEAALEEEGIQMSEGQSELSTSNGLEFPGFPGKDVPGYCAAAAWQPGKDVSFRAYRVRGSPLPGGGPGGRQQKQQQQQQEAFPAPKPPVFEA